MTRLVFASVRGAPGVTTTALAVAGCLPRPLLVEADPAGGVLAVRYGLAREPGLTTLAASEEQAGPEEVWEHTQELPGGLPMLVGPDAPQQASSLWQMAGAALIRRLDELDARLVVDAGRWSPGAPTRCLLGDPVRLVLVLRPTADGLVTAAHHLEELRDQVDVGLVLVGCRPYGSEEVAGELRCPVAGVIADDPDAAMVLTHGGGDRALRRSPLARSARSLADTLTASAGHQVGSERRRGARPSSSSEAEG